MYFPIKQQPSCATAWLAATKAVSAELHHEAYNVIVDVADPLAVSAVDQEIVGAVDRFLTGARQRGNKCYPVETVANTIFPQAVYDLHGSPAFYDVYLDKIYPRVKRTSGDWGRYFERMLTFPLPKKGKAIAPLRDLIDKMRTQVASERCFRNIYEMTIYDPVRDGGPVMNRQCLSFLSFKLSEQNPRQLHLTALYRNHYYTARLLGNLIGLGRLMRFVAQEVGIVVGQLTVVSTHAEVDAVDGRDNIDTLLQQCQAILLAKEAA